ncbi:formate/nitrite transporter family protein [Pontibacter silvestris]|uniref:Formate/nitrite transporter family protein n=1 Tax=Pontibacter silvestris TaxID=2305183 RepID=A0ABW4WT53_9BACT|nr:formate/nitrite transporter family protein [Pontibacter silvestris]MCC9138759.1 formate/nitrite transporter family protein [Pontibacter silvestris]
MPTFQVLSQKCSPPEALNVLKGLGYTVGFIIVILGRSELFIEHTTLAVFPVLAGDQRLSTMLRLWGIIFVGNIIGYFLEYIITLLEPHLLSTGTDIFEDIALHLTEYPWYIIFGSGIFAGWLLGILGWLDIASKETISRIVIIALITFIIGIGGFHHSIVGSIEVFAGVIVPGDRVSWSDLGKFQLWSTLGNIIGGVFFVGLVKYSHTIRALK